MRSRSGEAPLPSDAADDEFSDAELALIAAARAQFGREFRAVDALNLARVAREGEEARQRQRLDEIIAQVGQEKRNAILEVETAKLGITPDRLQKLTENPQRFRAVMDASRRYGNVDIETAISLLAEEEKRREVHAAVVTDRWAKAFDKSKPPRGDDWRRMDKLGPMIAAEMNAEKKAKAALKPKPPKTPKKTSWRQNPSFREAALHFAATGQGIVPMKLEQLNIATGREAEVLEAERQLELWDEQREQEGLDYAGFPWSDGDVDKIKK